MSRAFGPRRAVWIDIDRPDEGVATADELASLTRLDLIYRSLVAIQFNFSQSGHPGGSVSAGQIMTAALFDTMEYDVGDPNRDDQDLFCFAAGHKATGLYAMWALRDELARIGDASLLPSEDRLRLRWEDLLGFRRNPTHPAPLFQAFEAKPLDGHPTPMTPFLRIATGPSGVGMGASIGLAFAAADYFGKDAPRMHMIEGEGGLTPGRVYEAVAAAGSSGLSNVICHLDWNQASIDSDRVTREGGTPGDYVQWDPMEFFYIHDWNVVHVADGFDMGQVLTGQRRALEIDNGQPTAVVYRTEKGWCYGVTGKKSHGGGHGMCSDDYHEALRPLLGDGAGRLPDPPDADDPAAVEACQWETLGHVRALLEADAAFCREMAGRLERARDRLDARARRPRADAPDVERLYAACAAGPEPESLRLETGKNVPLRKQLGAVLGYLNERSGGAILLGAADLLDSTAISGGSKGFDPGYWHHAENPGSRTLTMGGICEDGLSCMLSGVSGFGKHVGAGASYGAFISPLGHIPARVHAISQQMRQHVTPGRYTPFILQCGHAGMKTGEDGPTHADPQALQLHIENYVPGTAVTLTPWEPQEIWPLMAAAIREAFAVVVPFVTRPSEPVLDREARGLAPAEAAAGGVYRLRRASGRRDGTVVLQGSGVTMAFVQDALPRLLEDGVDLEVIYVASPELFDKLPEGRRREVFPTVLADEAMGVTGFTLPTMYRWIRSDTGRAHTMHPFMKGHYLGSGAGEMVIHEAGMDGEGQYEGIRKYLDARGLAPDLGRRGPFVSTGRADGVLRTLLPALLAALGATAWLAAPLAAQDTPLFLLGGGPALPVGDTREVAGAGFTVGSAGVFPLAGRLGLEVGVSYTRLALEWDPALIALGIDPVSFRAAGGFVEGGHHWTGSASLGLQMLLRAREHRLVPHLHAGAGVARTGTAELRTWLLGEIEPHPGVLETALATALGAGVDVWVGEGMAVYARARYVVLFTDPVRRTMIPVQLGLALQLERR